MRAWGPVGEALAIDVRSMLRVLADIALATRSGAVEALGDALRSADLRVRIHADDPAGGARRRPQRVARGLGAYDRAQVGQAAQIRVALRSIATHPSA